MLKNFLEYLYGSIFVVLLILIIGSDLDIVDKIIPLSGGILGIMAVSRFTDIPEVIIGEKIMVNGKIAIKVRIRNRLVNFCRSEFEITSESGQRHTLSRNMYSKSDWLMLKNSIAQQGIERVPLTGL